MSDLELRQTNGSLNAYCADCGSKLEKTTAKIRELATSGKFERIDILCEKCGKIMEIGGVLKSPAVPISGTPPMYKYVCFDCDFHRLERMKYPVFVDGWKGRKNNE